MQLSPDGMSSEIDANGGFKVIVGLCGHSNSVRASSHMFPSPCLTKVTLRRAYSCSLCVSSASSRASVRVYSDTLYCPDRFFFSFRSVASDKRLVAGQTMPFLVRLLSDSHNALRHQSCTILYHLFENRANFLFFLCLPFLVWLTWVQSRPTHCLLTTTAQSRCSIS